MATEVGEGAGRGASDYRGRCLEGLQQGHLSEHCHLLQIFATIPVTTATAERSFSSLRLLKTYLRSTMKEDRLNGLALMAVHKDVRFKHDDVITEYAATHNRRFNFQ